MKKRIWISFPILLLLLFAGCACEHEWVAADCVNPQICAKCNESGEPALGHDWSEATCTTPETCTRCSETQGQPLGHDWLDATCTTPQTCSRCTEIQGEPLAHEYGEWDFSGEEMTHHCILCNQTETLPIDHELYLEQILSGHWNMYIVYRDGTNYTAQDLIQHNPKSNCAITFGPDKSCRITIGLIHIDTYDTSWSYQRVSKIDDVTYYVITAPYQDSVLYINVIFSDSRIAILNFITADAQIIFTKDIFIEKHLVGSWVVAENGSNNYDAVLQFNADRTVTGYAEDTIEGTWYPVKIDTENQTGILIEYLKDGATAYLKGTLDKDANIFYLSEYDMTFQMIDDAESTVEQGQS